MRPYNELDAMHLRIIDISQIIGKILIVSPLF